MSIIAKIRLMVVYGWTLPNTILGIVMGSLALISGGGVQIERGCLEFHGGLVKRLLEKMPMSPRGAAAMTLGHTILGVNRHELARCRDHEHVHVRQYQRWGPFFIPAYLACSAYLWFRNRDYYRENPFEVEAYRTDNQNE